MNLIHDWLIKNTNKDLQKHLEGGDIELGVSNDYLLFSHASQTFPENRRDVDLLFP